MSFIKESFIAYRKVQEALEKETSDHEIAMARSELEGIADKATATSSMLEGMTESGNPLPAWVQSKITNASDYITSVHDYLKYNPQINESVSLEETTFEKIYQMQQDGKTAEDIAKELKLKTDLVKKVLGEDREWTTAPNAKVIQESFTDIQIAQLKKEFDPLKHKQIGTARANQLSNILDKLDDGSLDKLKNALIPFVSAIASVKIFQRKARGVKITSVKVPGLEGMAEEKIPQDYLDYLRTIVLKNVDFYEVPPSKIIQSWRDEKNKDKFKGKMVDYKEEVELQEKPSIKQLVIFTSDKGTTHKEFSAYSEPELNKQIGDYLKQNPGYKVLKKEPVASIKETFKDNIVKKLVKPIQDFNKKKEEPKKEAVDNPYAIGMAAAMKATGDTPPLKKSTIVKAHKIADKVKKEEVELTELDSKRKRELKDRLNKLQYEKHFNHDANKEDLQKKIDDLKKQIEAIKEEDVSKEKETEFHKKLDTLVHKTFGKRKDEKTPVKEACWTGYKQVGLKKKGNKRVPNCVPEERRIYIESIVAVKNKAEKSGMPYSVLKQVYDRGMAAWKGGHRPGATQVQWALARVNSFVTKSSGTWGGADSDLAKKVKG